MQGSFWWIPKDSKSTSEGWSYGTAEGLQDKSTAFWFSDCPLHFPEQMGKLRNNLCWRGNATWTRELFHMEDPKALQMMPKVLCEIKDEICFEISKKRSCKNAENLSVQLWVYHNYSQQGFHEKGSEEVLKEQPENSQVVTGCWRCFQKFWNQRQNLW